MSAFDVPLNELRAILGKVDETSIDKACALLVKAHKTAVCGCGREALQMKGLAMRMFHLGLPVSVVGDMTATALGAGDLLFASSGPGETSTVISLMRTARAAGATALLITAQSTGTAATFADHIILIPAQTMADDQRDKRSSFLPMGSLFEGAMFLLFEILVLRLKTVLNVSHEAMRARHTNLE